MQLLNVSEVARMLKLSKRTIWSLRDRGMIPAALKVSGAVRWLASDLETWVAKGCPRCRPAAGGNKFTGEINAK